VLAVDFDPQGALSAGLGVQTHDAVTIYDLLLGTVKDPREAIQTTGFEGLDVIPANIDLSAAEVHLVNEVARETILARVLRKVSADYDVILIDCQPSLGMLTVNALTAANHLLIPVQAEYLPTKGLEQLLQTVKKVRKQINPTLQIDGILLTMVDSRTNFAKEISSLLRETYGSSLNVFRTEIPHSVKAKESNAEGKSIYAYDDSCKVAEAYKNLVREVLYLEKQREKRDLDLGR
jgi:chromosome partitioning protein